jgi:hypothetical protein
MSVEEAAKSVNCEVILGKHRALMGYGWQQDIVYDARPEKKCCNHESRRVEAQKITLTNLNSL